jgi:transposase
MEFIRGEDREQIILLPESVDEYVEENGTVRIIDAYINSLDMGLLGFNRDEPKETGRPPYNPKDLLKLYIYGYMNRIRSSRRLEAESKRNLEAIWLLRKLSPDHKTIANFRKLNPKALKNVFKDFVKLCVKLDLYGKELAGIDGCKFKAVNSKERNFTKDKLKDRIERMNKKIDEYLKELDENDTEENVVEKEKSAQEIKEIIRKLNERKTLYQEYADELEKTGETQKSLTDPESRLMLSNSKMDVCYNVQTAVDAKNKLIIEYEVTNNANDMNQLTPMTGKVQDILETKEIAVTADKGYASVTDIAEAVRLGADLHVAGTDSYICVPVEKEDQTEITPDDKGRCVYVKERNIAICPMGQTLYPAFYKKSKGEAVFCNSQACKECEHRCTSETRAFRYQFVMDESNFKTDYDDKELYVKQVHIKPDKNIYAQRKSICEHPFGTVKQSMDGRYCLTKGIKKIAGEFALIFLAYNLKRVINILGTRKLMEALS